KVEIEVVDQGDYRVLRPSGDLDVYTVGSLRDAIGNMIEQASPKIVVDLDGVPFMDSSGLGALMGGVRRLREAGGDLAIACTREQHLKLFAITGFGEGVSIAPTVEEAAGGFRA
ncbi:MAG TPA: STAS domain-containing protein, partial [Actinomycetota bacterium]|nr:STAS domain-containing protein [Actinomycetota bacterium]